MNENHQLVTTGSNKPTPFVMATSSQSTSLSSTPPPTSPLESKEVKEAGGTTEDTQGVKVGETKRETKESAEVVVGEAKGVETKIDGEVWQTWGQVKQQSEIKGYKIMDADTTGWGGYKFWSW